MKIKIIIYLMSAILAGYLVGIFFLNNKEEQTVIGTNIGYFIQDAVYTEKPIELENDYSKIICLDDNKYYSYVGITLSSSNALKIKEYYDYLGVSTYIKEITLDSNEFISSLAEYDNLLSNTNGDEIIGILKVILATYKEMEHC